MAEQYSAIIDSILEGADLNTISAKRIRKGLQERLGHDISGEKVRTQTLRIGPRALTTDVESRDRPHHGALRQVQCRAERRPRA